MEIVLISFRLGLHVQRAACHVGSQAGPNDGYSWSYEVSGMTEEAVNAMLEEFHQEKVNIPKAKFVHC